MIGRRTPRGPSGETRRMRKLCVTLWLVMALAIPSAAVAQPGEMSTTRPGTAAARKDKPRQGNWLTNIQNATGQARKEDKLILAYFRGSDWCDFCKKLDREVLNTDLFIDWADKNIVLLDVDFPAE